MVGETIFSGSERSGGAVASSSAKTTAIPRPVWARERSRILPIAPTRDR